jgi:DNA-binding GntR family transcriptional regulator
MPGPGAHFVHQLHPQAVSAGGQAEVLAELRRVITSGQAMPGALIHIDEVATTLGVSTIPVREVLKTLVAEGLVSHAGRRGYRVIQLTSAEYEEINLMFSALEGIALPIALERATSEHHEGLRELLARQREGLEWLSIPQWQDITREIHFALLEPSGMSQLIAMYRQLWARIDVGMPWRHSSRAQRVAMVESHERLIHALIAKDLPELERARREHDASLASTVSSLAALDDAGYLFRTE